MPDDTTSAATAGETKDPTTTPEPEAKPNGNGDGDNTGLPESIKAILDKERQAARDAERRAKAAEKKAQEYEDRDKSAEEQAAARAERAEKRAEEAEKRLIRTQVALEKGVPADLMDFLVGDTRQEIEAKADVLMAHTKPNTATDFDSGVRETQPENKTPEQQHQETLMRMLRPGAPVT